MRCKRAAELAERRKDWEYKPVEPVSRPRQRMPADEEAAERRCFDRLDFLPQARQRSLADRAQHFDIAPFAPAATRTELTVDDAATRQ